MVNWVENSRLEIIFYPIMLGIFFFDYLMPCGFCKTIMLKPVFSFSFPLWKLLGPFFFPIVVEFPCGVFCGDLFCSIVWLLSGLFQRRGSVLEVFL